MAALLGKRGNPRLFGVGLRGFDFGDLQPDTVTVSGLTAVPLKHDSRK